MKVINLKILTVMILFFGIVFSQSLEKLENNAVSVKTALLKLELQRDSLNQLLKTNNQQIEKTRKSEEALKLTYSKSGELSEKIKEINSLIENKSAEFEQLRDEIFQLISKELTSINQVTNRERFLILTHKQIIYAPIVSQLNYNPEILLNENFVNGTDEFEKKQLSETFEGALNEVNEHINKLDVIQKEIGEISELNRLANEFTEDIEFDSDVTNFNSINSSSDLNKALSSSDRNDLYNELIKESLGNYHSILNQLTLVEVGNISNVNAMYPKLQKNLSLQNYLSYLNEVSLILKKYGEILKTKQEMLNE